METQEFKRSDEVASKIVMAGFAGKKVKTDQKVLVYRDEVKHKLRVTLWTEQLQKYPYSSSDRIIHFQFPNNLRTKAGKIYICDMMSSWEKDAEGNEKEFLRAIKGTIREEDGILVG